MTRKQLASAKARTRSHDHRYPDWVYSIREDITRRNMDLYDQQQEKIRSRCIEINPSFYSLPWLDRQTIWTQARKDLGLD